MKIQDALKSSEISSLDAEVLLSSALQRSRTWLHAHTEDEIDMKELERFRDYCLRRERNEPIAYIIGKQEFYGRTFQVNDSVLIPRCSTEGIIDASKSWDTIKDCSMIDVDTNVVITCIRFGASKINQFVDVCTGSGCIGITLLLEGACNECIATDISTAALEVAKRNAHTHGVENRMKLYESDLLQSLPEISQPYVIVSNPPYVPIDDIPMKDVYDYEPHLALFGGKDGMSLIVELYRQAQKQEQCQGLLIECRKEQAIKLLELHKKT